MQTTMVKRKPNKELSGVIYTVPPVCDSFGNPDRGASNIMNRNRGFKLENICLHGAQLSIA